MANTIGIGDLGVSQSGGSTSKDVSPLQKARSVAMACESEIHQTDNIYFITWNPKPDFYVCPLKLGEEFDYKKNWIKMIDRLRELRRCCKKYCIIPEISLNGKLHCHGWIELTDTLKWKRSVCHKLGATGFYKISEWKHRKDKAAFKYYQKEIGDTIGLGIPAPLLVFSHLTDRHIKKALEKERIWLDLAEGGVKDDDGNIIPATSKDIEVMFLGT